MRLRCSLFGHALGKTWRIEDDLSGYCEVYDARICKRCSEIDPREGTLKRILALLV